MRHSIGFTAQTVHAEVRLKSRGVTHVVLRTQAQVKHQLPQVAHALELGLLLRLAVSADVGQGRVWPVEEGVVARGALARHHCRIRPVKAKADEEPKVLEEPTPTAVPLCRRNLDAWVPSVEVGSCRCRRLAVLLVPRMVVDGLARPLAAPDPREQLHVVGLRIANSSVHMRFVSEPTWSQTL